MIEFGWSPSPASDAPLRSGIADRSPTEDAPSPGRQSGPGSTIRRRRRALYDLFISNLTYKVDIGRSRCRGKEGEVGKSRVLLDKVNATANNSEVLAIIGRSGSSKTTLLDALAGRIDPKSLEGSILVNGKLLHHGLKSISGYVMQEDDLFPMLTVRETLLFSARLRVPSEVTRGQKRERVEALIKELGLTSCCDTRVGSKNIRGISGGEKRRLSIGVDVIHDPPVLLLDEPTSGLDSTSALQVMETLHAMAVRRRHTVILTVHQPSYRMLSTIHNTLVLAKGNVVYHGHSSGMMNHFSKLQGRRMPEHVNVVEYALDTIAEVENKPEAFQKLLALARKENTVEEMESEGCTQAVMDEESHGFRQLTDVHGHGKYATSFMSEILVLSQRNSYNIFRTKTLFFTRVTVTILTNLIMVSLFIHSPISEKGIRDRQVFLIFTLAILAFTSTEGLPNFLLEKQIFIRETSRGAYRASSYAMAHTLVVLPFLLFQAALCCVFSYFAVGLVLGTAAIFFFTLVIFLLLAMANAFVVMVSGLVPDFTVGLGVVGGATAYMFLFSGFFINKSSIPRYWLWMYYISFFKYPFDSLLANEFEHRPGTIWYDGIDSAQVLHNLIEDKQSQIMRVLIMVGFILGYRFIFYLALRFGTKSLRK